MNSDTNRTEIDPILLIAETNSLAGVAVTSSKPIAAFRVVIV